MHARIVEEYSTLDTIEMKKDMHIMQTTSRHTISMVAMSTHVAGIHHEGDNEI